MKVRIRRVGISEGASSLSAVLRARGVDSRLLKLSGSTYRDKGAALLINWGQCESNVGLNPAHATRVACDKVQCFSRLEDNNIPIPDYTHSIEEANTWLTEQSSVVCRTLTRASGGRGIVIADSAEQLVNAPLFTRYIKKKAEYRVHVFNGAVIDVQYKARNPDNPTPDWRIRSHDNGFIFVREGVELAQQAKQLCIDAVRCVGIDFGAVDLIYNEHHNQYYVLEINTAPGITGTTVEKYAEAIINYMRENNYE